MHAPLLPFIIHAGDISWVTVVWSIVAGMCLTLAGLNVLVWRLRREVWGYGIFALSASATAAMAGCELWMMRAQTAQEWALALQWLHLPGEVIIISLVGFVRVYLRAGRPWLAWAIGIVRGLVLLVNFCVTPNFNYSEVKELRHVSFLGELVSVGVGAPNHWMFLGQAGLVLLIVFVVDASLTLWRRGKRRQALVVGGSMIFFSLVGTANVILTMWGIVRTPFTPSLFYVGIVVAMALELSYDVLYAAQLAEQLRENEQRMNLAVDSANFGIWIRDLTRNEIWASDKWRNLFGFGPADRLELGGVLKRIHPDDRDAFRHTLDQAVATSGHYETEYRVVLPDGSLRWISSRGRVEFDPPGQPVRVRGASLDFTAWKRAEEETALLRQEMAHVDRVSMMGQLASALAHEISQPLGAILRNAEAAELFMQHPSPDLDEIRAIVADIRKDDQRACAVIDRMRMLLRRQQLVTQTLNVSEFVGDVTALTRMDAAVRRVKVEVIASAELPPVRGDRVHLQQVLLNLIMNGMDAVSAASENQRRVTVGARRIGERVIEISVSDTGSGIPVEKLSHIFDPFFTTKANGMGMGLAISRTIIEAHGGRIWAENNPDRGATFRFSLETVEDAPQI